MAVYASNYVITVDGASVGAIEHAEAMVRGALDRAPAEPLVLDGAPLVDAERGETVIGWLAYIPGPDDAQYVTWEPGTELPRGATQLHCRGKRTT